MEVTAEVIVHHIPQLMALLTQVVVVEAMMLLLVELQMAEAEL